MSSSDSSLNTNTIDDIADDFVARYRRGERPAVAEYTAKHPEHAAEIAAILPALIAMEALKPASEDIEGSLPQAATAPLQKLGDFRIVREIGRGGMGIVYEAIQESLGRKVALKVLPKQGVTNPARHARFEREARAAAKLHHTNIVPVFGVGSTEGVHYYAMQYIRGLGLDIVLEQLKASRTSGSETPQEMKAAIVPSAATEPIPMVKRELAATIARSLISGVHQPADAPSPVPEDPNLTEPNVISTTALARRSDILRMPVEVQLPGKATSSTRHETQASYFASVARIGVQVAEALQYAHDQGVLHRDIKPSNLLLDTHGVVWVTDFGLAKADDQRDLTQTGDVLGTLRYMSPESFSGKSDRQSDVYSLGLTLYELLAMQPAYTASEKGALIRQVLNETPSPLRLHAPTLPRDLETIVHKAIDRDTSHRYHLAQELADDLQRYLRDEPIHARRASLFNRFNRWCKRNPAVAALTMTIAGLLLIATVISSLAAQKFRGVAAERAQAIRELKSAQLAAQKSAENEKRLRIEAQRQQRQTLDSLARARRAVNEYLHQVTESELLSVPGLQPLRRDLLQSALSFYSELIDEHGDDGSLVREVALARFRLAQIYRELGPVNLAREMNATAIAALDKLRDSSAGDPEVLAALSVAFANDIRFDDAIAVCQQGLTTNPQDSRLRGALAEHYNALAVQMGANRPEGAIQYHQKALSLRESLVRDFPDRAEHLAALGATLNNLGNLIGKQPERASEAVAMYERSTEYVRKAWQRAPHSVLWGRWLAINLKNVATTRETLEPPAADASNIATTAWVEYLSVSRQLVLRNPAVTGLRSELHRAHIDVANHYRRCGRVVDADLLVQRAQSLLDEMPRESPLELLELAMMYSELAQEDAAQGEKRDSQREKHCQLALDALRQAHQLGLRDFASLARREFDVLRSRADFQTLELALRVEAVAAVGGIPEDQIHQGEQTERQIREALKRDAESIQHRQMLASVKHSIGVLHGAAGRYAEAVPALKEAIQIQESLKRPGGELLDPHKLAATYKVLGDVRYGKLELPGMHQAYQRAITLARESLSRDELTNHDRQSLVSQVVVPLGATYANLGVWSEAVKINALAVKANRAPPEWNENMHDIYAAILDDAESASIYRQRALERAKLIPDPYVYLPQLVRKGVPEIPKPELMEILTKSQRLDPHNIWRNFYHALAHYHSGEFSQAYEVFQKHETEMENNYAFFSGYAMFAHATDRTSVARDWMKRAESYCALTLHNALIEDNWQHEARSDPAHRGASWIYFQEACPKILGNASPVLAWNHLLESPMWRAMGETERADQCLLEAMKESPDRAEIYSLVAMLSARANRDGDGDANFWKRVIEQHEGSPQAWIARGRWHATRGDYSRADSDFTQATKLDPNNLNQFFESGWWAAGPIPGPTKEREHDYKPDPAKPFVVKLQSQQKSEPISHPWLWRSVDSSGRAHLAGSDPPQGSYWYAFAYVFTEQERTVVPRVSQPQGDVRLWIKGIEVPIGENAGTFAHVKLAPGRNEILVSCPKQSLILRLDGSQGE